MKSRLFKRGLTVVASLAVGALALSACSSNGGTTSSPAEGSSGGNDTAASKVIGVSIADQKSLFYISAVNGMRQAAEEAGYELIVLSADNNSTQQVNQVQDLLAQGVGVLIYTPQDATAAAAGVELANDAGVPVVAVDQKPESGDGVLATYIATDSVKAAYELCTWLFAQIDNEGDIAVLQGPLGATAEIQRTQGCQNALDENPNVNVVQWESAGWDETLAFEATQNILTANPNLKAIFGESDAMALGAAKAAEQAGRTGLYFVGIDGFPTMFEAIASGLVQATMAQQPYLMGQLAVRDAIKILNGEGGTVPELQYQDTVLVTRENVAENDASVFYGPDFQ
jgi:ribose transport system substrate-binding protein